MFEPERLTKPDVYGYFHHPDIPGEDESDDVVALCQELGYDAAFVSFESDAPAFLQGAYFDREDQTAVGRWTPKCPKGVGWQLVSKYDTEDGPCAMFVRPIVKETKQNETLVP